MKKIFSLILMTLIATSVFAANLGKQERAPKRILVQLTENVNASLHQKIDGNYKTGISQLDIVLKEAKVNNFKPLYGFNDRSALAEKLGMTKQYVLNYSSDLTEEEVAAKFAKTSSVVWAEPDYKFYLDAAYNPTDSLVNSQWYLNKINAKNAWGDYQKGAITDAGDTIIVAIVDTGIKRIHRDLRRSIFKNMAEINGTASVDDDGNGKIDDFYGWDFSDNDNTLLHDFDMTGGGEDHGSHCSGIAAATDHTDLPANTGIVGVGFAAKIIAAKIFPNSYPSVSAPAIRYVADMGAAVSSNSWGSYSASSAIESAINYSVATGTIFLAATGNDNKDLTTNPHYPSSYENAMGVCATDSYDYKAGFSNYATVEPYASISAPGTSILSTTDILKSGKDYDSWDGTSMATPVVAGVAALCIAKHPAYATDEAGVNALRALLKSTGDTPASSNIPDRINVNSALAAIPSAGEPTCSIIAPTAGTTVVIPANVDILVTAADPAKSGIDHVEIWIDDVNKGNATLAAPNYTFTWSTSGVSVGSHTIKAIAQDDEGNRTTSSPIEITISDGSTPVVILEEGFEGGALPTGWLSIDADGDTYKWAISPDGMANHTGSYCFQSASYDNTAGALTPDNWLVTPQLALNANGNVNYWVCAQDAAWAGEHYGVYISTTGTSASDFTLLFEETMTAKEGKAAGAYYEKNVSLAGYTGNVYVAFRHFNCTDMFILNLDDVKIECDNAIGNEGNISKDFTLEQNYPNPFNPTTSINFNLNKVANVKLTVFNTKGQFVQSLLNNKLSAGTHNVKFDASALNSGVYYYTLETPAGKLTKKMLLVK